MGWEPAETHVHEYDDAGRLVRTAVTREAEWDDTERAKALAWEQYRSEICACGLHRSVADEDPDLDLTDAVCPVCAALARAGRIMEERDKEAMRPLGEKPPAGAARPGDGRRFRVVPKGSAEEERHLGVESGDGL